MVIAGRANGVYIDSDLGKRHSERQASLGICDWDREIGASMKREPIC